MSENSINWSKPMHVLAVAGILLAGIALFQLMASKHEESLTHQAAVFRILLDSEAAYSQTWHKALSLENSIKWKGSVAYLEKSIEQTACFQAVPLYTDLDKTFDFKALDAAYPDMKKYNAIVEQYFHTAVQTRKDRALSCAPEVILAMPKQDQPYAWAVLNSVLDSNEATRTVATPPG